MDADRTVQLLEQIRKDKGMSKDKFAVTELEVNYRTYQRWVAGDTKPSDSNKDKIYKYLKNHKDLIKPVKVEANVEIGAGVSVEATATVLTEEPIWPTLPKRTWEKLEDMNREKVMKKVQDTLKEIAEDKKTKADG